MARRPRSKIGINPDRRIGEHDEVMSDTSAYDLPMSPAALPGVVVAKTGGACAESMVQAIDF
ncbi:MAG: hypothetical protein ACR2GK_03945 [Gemmatimonadaceae bacterium]